MSHAALGIAILGIGLPLYSYAGYPLLLFLLASVVQMGRDAYYLVSRSERRRRSERLPRVSLLLAAYNEEKVIERTLRNCLAVDYPRDRLEIIVGSDGSSDGTDAIIRRFEGQGVRWLRFDERRGKLPVIRDCVAQAGGDILVLSDADTILQDDSIRNLVRHFDDPGIGAVCGEWRLVRPDGAAADEGIYWRYELVLRLLESRLGSTLGASGAIYAVRRELFPALPARLVTDDFVIPMKVRSRGFRVLFDPEAVAVETAPAGVEEEFRRRVRIGAGNWQALWYCRELLLPWKGFVSLAFWSHKVLRWFTPFLLVGGLAANACLLAQPFWRVVFVIQLAFYAAAALGYALRRLRLPAGPLRIAHYFIVINLALALGMARGMLGRQRAAWEHTSRQAAGSGERP
jgi:cellulose synthase/poly-beta-1,6-N-acetylglucosamine synthase-like glycosyltransferase